MIRPAIPPWTSSAAKLLLLGCFCGVFVEGLSDFLLGGLPGSAQSVPNPDGPGWCSDVGHRSCQGGGRLNPFGSDFKSQGHRWTTELCRRDSDGDGLTNGEELGDPCCTWKPGADADLLFQTAASHPGFPQSVPSAEAQATLDKVDCCNVQRMPRRDHVLLGSTSFYNEGEDVLSKTMLMTHTSGTSETQYVYFFIDLGTTDDGSPWEDPLYMVGWTVNFGLAGFVHHVVLHGCTDKKPAQDPPRSGGYMPSGPTAMAQLRKGCGAYIATAELGQHEYALPRDVATPLGPGTQIRRLLAQVHYNNPQHTPGLLDHTSITVHLTSAPRPHAAGIWRLGDGLMEDKVIPPGEASWHVSSRCLILTRNEQEVTVFAHRPHMHLHGSRLWSEKMHVSGNLRSDSAWQDAVFAARSGKSLERLAGTDHYDFRSQVISNIHPRLVLRHGDVVTTTCVFNTTHERRYVRGGTGTQAEMCMHWFYIYPESAVKLVCSHDKRFSGRWPQELSSVAQHSQVLQDLMRPSGL